MDIKLFLQTVLPSQGRRFMVAIKNKTTTIPRRVHTNQQLVDTAQQFDAQGFDVYFAVGGYVEAVNAKGHPSREAEHAQWHRSLRLDIDVEANNQNKYATKQEALQALVVFINALKLPTPIVIDSGGGYHVYWVLDRDITRDVWQGLADRLKSAGKMLGFRIDPTATADAARILRMPGTHNFKSHFGPAGVEVVCVNENVAITPMDPAQFDVLLPAVQELEAAGVQVAPVRNNSAPKAPGSELSANVNQHTPYDLSSVIKECSVLTDMLVKRGNGYHNQQWYLMLNAIQASMHTDKQKRDIALMLSDGWRDGAKAFNEQDFDNTFNRAKNGHPFSCATMANSGEPASSLCKACPYYSDNLSSVGKLGYNGFKSKRNPPVQPQQQQQAAAAFVPGQIVTVGPFKFLPDGRIEVVDGKLGSGHFSVEHGMPCKTHTNGSGKPVQRPILGNYVLKEVTRSGSASSNQVDAVFTRGKDTDVPVTLNDTALSSTPEMSNVLTRHRLYGQYKSTADDFRFFMNTFLGELQKVAQASNILSQCGWTDSGDFVWGLTTFHRSGGSTQARAASDKRMESYKSAGDEAVWQQGFDIILKSGADRQMLLALGIASPLMHFTSLSAVMINMLSESGTGKTTTSDAVQSIWGDPDKLRLGLHDTDNAIYQIAGVTGNLPLVLDEKTIADGEALLQQVHTLTQGRQKHRMDAKAQVIAPHDYWALLTFTSSNTSVIGRLMRNNNTDTGGPARVFEVNMSNLGMTIAEQSANKPMLHALKTNYGWLAPKICALLVSQPASYWQNLVATTVARVDASMNKSGETRYHSAVAALAEIGAVLGKHALGLNFDIQAVKDEAMKHWAAQQALVTSVRREPMDYVRDYFLDKGQNMVVYVGNDAGRRSLQSTNIPAGEVHVTSQLFVVREQTLRDFVNEKKGIWETVKKGLEAHPATLGRGKRQFLANAPGEGSAYVMCYEFDLRQLKGTLHAVPATDTTTTQVLP